MVCSVVKYFYFFCCSDCQGKDFLEAFEAGGEVLLTVGVLAWGGFEGGLFALFPQCFGAKHVFRGQKSRAKLYTPPPSQPHVWP